MKKVIIGECFLCGQYTYLERHHIFGGAFRTKAEKDGLVVNLCHFCHNEPPNGAHHNKETMLKLRQYGQRIAMEKHKWTTDDFIREYGKNYLL